MRDFIAREDGLMTARMKGAGCIVIGKTNVPEFGLGSHTFNEVFGTTFNAYDVTKSAGGSSGGAAVALALGLLPVVDGSDLMGSLRTFWRCPRRKSGPSMPPSAGPKKSPAAPWTPTTAGWKS